MEPFSSEVSHKPHPHVCRTWRAGCDLSRLGQITYQKSIYVCLYWIITECVSNISLSECVSEWVSENKYWKCLHIHQTFCPNPACLKYYLSHTALIHTGNDTFHPRLLRCAAVLVQLSGDIISYLAVLSQSEHTVLSLVLSKTLPHTE